MRAGGLLVFADDAGGARLAARRFGGLTLLERGIRTLARAGATRILVVLPAGTPVALGRVTRRLDLDLEIVCWGAAPRMAFADDEQVLLLLGDHAHHHSSLAAFLDGGTTGAALVAQVSLAPAQQTGFVGVRAVEGEPQLRFDVEAGAGASVSTGAFLCAGALRPHELAASGLSALEFLWLRAAGRPTATRPGDPALWRRVVDGRSARQAKGMLFGQVTKKTSGPVSRHLNARLSIPLSKVLIETGISPHMVTVLFVLTTGLGAALLMARPEPYWRLALAGFLWQMAAVLDRCDGEIARVKLCESKFGAWFDTVTDNLAYLCTYAGFLFGVRHVHAGQPLYFYAAVSAVVALLVTLAVMYNYALKTGSGSLQNYLVGFARHVPDHEKGALYRWFERYAFIAKRDQFSFIYFLCALSGVFDFIYFYTVGGLHLLALAVLISQRRMLEGHRRRTAVEAHTGRAGDPAAVAAAPGMGPR